jgi:hypothetical protein
MSSIDERSAQDAITGKLRAHFVYMSNSDEEELVTRASRVDGDVADIALRTCLCGARIDGFDEYANHLEAVFGADIEGH